MTTRKKRTGATKSSEKTHTLSDDPHVVVAAARRLGRAVVTDAEGKPYLTILDPRQALKFE